MKTKIINSATEEIFSTIQESINTCERDEHVGNYWINNNFNIFAETDIETHQGDNNPEEMYILIHLEKYDDDENCLDGEVDVADTLDMSKESLRKSIEALLSRNENILSKQ